MTKRNRMAHTVLATSLVVAAMAWSLSPTAAAQDDGERDRVIRQANQLFRQMRSQPYTARMTGCGGWDCNDATIHIQMPGKLRIAYDYNSIVIADGQELITYSGGDQEVNRGALAEAPLSCLLAGELGGAVSVDAVQTVDRGPESGAPRHIYRVDVSRDSQRLTLLFAKDRFRLLGWIVTSGQGDFTVELRDLRPARGASPELFAPIPQPAPEAESAPAPSSSEVAPNRSRRRRARP